MQSSEQGHLVYIDSDLAYFAADLLSLPGIDEPFQIDHNLAVQTRKGV